MTNSRLKGVTVKLDKEIYQTILDTSNLTNIPVRFIFDEALRLYIVKEKAKNLNLKDALIAMKNARENRNTK